MSPKELEKLKQDIRITQELLRHALILEECENSLRAFVKASWLVIEPGTPYVHGWYIDAICDHLEAVVNGEIRKLIINIPPRCMKSTLCAIAFPAWVWLKSPERKFLYSSYDLKLSMRDSRKCNALIKSAWYQRTWAERFSILTAKGGQDTKQRFDNNKGGYRIATATNVGTTGDGGDVIFYDDPNDLNQMNSDAYVEQVIFFHEHVMRSRLNDPRTGVRVCIQQRSSERDMTGHILSKEQGWDHLVIPMAYEGSKKATSIGWVDPRKNHGDLMCPERIGPEEIKELQGNAIAWCTPGFTPILMADWSENRIDAIKVGDEIIGFEPGGAGRTKQKAFLKHATVTAISVSQQPVVRLVLESGRDVYCTRDHKWYRRGKGPLRQRYAPARVKTSLHSVYQPVQPVNHDLQRAYDWLGGILDGEGSCPWRGPITISQSAANPDVQDAIKGTLNLLSIENTFWQGERRPSEPNPHWALRGHWHLNGGRSTKIKLLAHCRMAKRQRIIDSLWESSSRLTESLKNQPKHKVMRFEQVGVMTVYGLTTTTGNYVAWGFASQNSGQYQQRPSPGEGAKFKREWFRYWNPRDVAVNPETQKHNPVRIEIPGAKEPLYKIPETVPAAFEQVLQSWDLAFKDAEENDFVAGHVWGRVGANCYLIGHVYEHLDFVQTLARFRKMNTDFPGCPEKLIEDKANGPAVVSTLRNEIPGIIPINPEGGKVARANAVTPYVESGNVYLPNPDLFPWVRDFIEQCANFPRAKHDDEVDAMTQALRRLYDTQANSALPEFRVSPRVGEPQSACHVVETMHLEPHWRRWISMVPGAALWMCETPQGSVRIYRELDLSHLDGRESGRRIAEQTLDDVRDRMRLVGRGARWVCDILMEKDMFEPMEPIGCLAELVADGAQNYRLEKEGFGERTAANADLGYVQFSAEMVEVVEAAWDRLRDLLRFAPPDFQKVDYDRAYAKTIFERSPDEWRSYMAAVEGEPAGEWPKVKFSSECPKTLAAIGTASRIQGVNEIAEPFLRALLVGITTPEHVQAAEAPRQIPWGPNGPRFQRPQRRGGRLRIAV